MSKSLKGNKLVELLVQLLKNLPTKFFENKTTHTHAHTHTNWHITQPLKKNEILPFAAVWMDLENIMLSEISQRQILYDITYMRNQKKYKKECVCQTETESQI